MQRTSLNVPLEMRHMVPLDILVVIVIGVIIVGFLAAIVQIYNRLTRFRNAADATFGQIRVAMKKRLDMIEQLLGAVRGYTEHERGVFETVAKLRAGIESESANLGEIDRESRRLVGSLVAVAEAYPELRASETVTKLMEAIVSVEDEIARHRYTYNNVVQEYNTMQDTIPSNFVAGAVGSVKLDYLRFEGAEKVPEVSVR